VIGNLPGLAGAPAGTLLPGHRHPMVTSVMMPHDVFRVMPMRFMDGQGFCFGR